MKTRNPASVHRQAIGFMKKSRYLDATKLLRGEFRKIKGDWRALWDLGWCYYNLKRFAEAGRYFNLADGVSSGNAICRWARGLVYIKKQEYEKAEIVLSDSLRLRERFHTRIALALTYLALGKVELAEKTHLDGIRMGTRLTERYESYAAFLSDVGREAEAKKIEQKVRERQRIQ
jgi:tetratricopeptide (TPR) repeat protein